MSGQETALPAAIAAPPLLEGTGLEAGLSVTKRMPRIAGRIIRREEGKAGHAIGLLCKMGTPSAAENRGLVRPVSGHTATGVRPADTTMRPTTVAMVTNKLHHENEGTTTDVHRSCFTELSSK